MTTVYIALGSNLGDRRATISAAVDRLRLAPGIDDLQLSALRETEPVGGPPDQPPYLNAVARISTSLAPRNLLARLQQIEADLGRVRRESWGPRTIDLDLLLYDDATIDEPDLTIPHPRMHQRRFVLAPLAELAPDLVHPILNRTITDLLAHVDKADASSNS